MFKMWFPSAEMTKLTLFHTYWDLQLELIFVKHGSETLAANALDNGETTFAHVRNPFRPIRKRLSKGINIFNECGSFVDGASFFTAWKLSLVGFLAFRSTFLECLKRSHWQLWLNVLAVGLNH